MPRAHAILAQTQGAEVTVSPFEQISLVVVPREVLGIGYGGCGALGLAGKPCESLISLGSNIVHLAYCDSHACVSLPDPAWPVHWQLQR